MLTAALKNWIVKLANSRFDWCHCQVDFNASAVVQGARINRSGDVKSIRMLNIYY